MFIGILDAGAVLLLEFVFFRRKLRIAELPKPLDKSLAIGIRGKLLEFVPLLIRNDLDDLFVQPIVKSWRQFILSPEPWRDGDKSGNQCGLHTGHRNGEVS